MKIHSIMKIQYRTSLKTKYIIFPVDPNKYRPFAEITSDQNMYVKSIL
jgi:hypothetical protein